MKRKFAKKILGVFLSTVFITVFFLGVHGTMSMDSEGAMKNCPLLGSSETVCTMTILEHIAKWREFFTFPLQTNKLLFAALVFIAFALTVFSFRFLLFHRLHFQAVGIRAGPLEYSRSFLLKSLAHGVLRKRE